MSETDTQGDSPTAAAERTWALILDLDTAAVDGVDALRKAFTDALSTIGITLEPVLFARFLLGETPTSGLSSLLTHLKQPKDKLSLVVEALHAAMGDSILQSPVRITARALVEQSERRGGVLVSLTSYPVEIHAKLLALLGLPEDARVVQVHPDGCGYLGPDAWFRAAHTAQIPERNCLAVTATADSARAAVMSNLTVAAFVGPLTEHQDFSGVDWLGKGSTAKEADVILEMLFARL